MRPPDLANEAGTIRAWRWTATPGVGPADWQAGLATWCIQADAGVLDPVFATWLAGGVSLRDVEGVPPAHRQYPDAQYELVVFTINPESGVGSEHYARLLEVGVGGSRDSRQALDKKLRESAEAAWAAGAAEAAEAAEAAGAAGKIDWSKVKGKSFSQQKAYFRELLRPYIEAKLGQAIEESTAEGLALLDAMLDLAA